MESINNAVNPLQLLFDDGIYNELDALVKNSSVTAAYGYVNGVKAYAFSQNGGVFTAAQCRKIVKLYELATKTGAPVFGFYASEGVALNEGFEAYSAYSELLNKAFSVSGVIPQISVICGDCLGVAALMCNTADVVVAVEGSDVYVAANKNDKTETLFEKGVADILKSTLEEAVSAAKSVALLLPSNNLMLPARFDFTAPAFQSDDILASLADEGSLIELKGGFATSIVTALATVGGQPVGLVAFTGKALCPNCSYKAEALVKLCDAFNLPIITVADSPGFSDKDSAQMITALTKLASAYAAATCPKISLITKEASGGAYILLAGKGANADITLAWSNAVVSPLAPASAVAFLYGEQLASGADRAVLENTYREGDGAASAAAAFGDVDAVLEPKETRNELMKVLEMLSSKRETTIPRKHTVK